ncbi:procathepsin L-like [Daktulosphaira vitifoliae]|uniref:procathepsin L-like n=1 Tax=Daktulosphaira vitifoliae TaxID=58002 RepID=UPI0021AAE8E1|nr:procathepsin L-like [Daktulosphaira vitifoliae]
MWNELRRVILLLAFCNLGHTLKAKYTPQLDLHWNIFKDTHNKTYSRTKEIHHRLVWEENFHHTKKHNDEAKDGKHNYTLYLNHLSDMPPKMYDRHFTRLSHSKLPASKKVVISNIHRHHNVTQLPEEFDWRDKGFKTPAWNQLDCGACYAFSIASMLEGQLFKETGKLHTLSSQQIIDCSIAYGNLGCSGGSFRNTLEYIKRVGGIMQGIDYTYKAKETLCHFRKFKAILQISSWSILPPFDEHALKATVALVGPVSVSVNASPKTFQLYSSGIYDDPMCSSTYVNHAMLLIGYTKNAWILKNWWSSLWGDNGYMYMARGRNQCAIASYAAYATIKDPKQH